MDLQGQHFLLSHHREQQACKVAPCLHSHKHPGKDDTHWCSQYPMPRTGLRETQMQCAAAQ